MTRDEWSAAVISLLVLVLVAVACGWGLGLGLTDELPVWAAVSLVAVGALTWIAVPVLKAWDARRWARDEAERAARRRAREQTRTRVAVRELPIRVRVTAERLDRPGRSGSTAEADRWAA